MVAVAAWRAGWTLYGGLHGLWIQFGQGVDGIGEGDAGGAVRLVGFTDRAHRFGPRIVRECVAHMYAT